MSFMSIGELNIDFIWLHKIFSSPAFWVHLLQNPISNIDFRKQISAYLLENEMTNTILFQLLDSTQFLA